MTEQSARVVICGAGMAGISAAYSLAVRHGVRDVVLVDERPPLSLTSAVSTECYRNWWPGPGDAMVALMNHSLDLIEQLARQTGNAFHLNRRGYLFATAQEARIQDFRQAGEEASSLGAGPLREQRGRPDDPAYLPAPDHGFEGQPTGADLITDPTMIQAHFPYLSPETVAALHVRRAGWFSAQQLGSLMLQQAQEQGVRLIRARVEGVSLAEGRVQSVRLGGGEGPANFTAEHFVIAAGPLLKEVAAMVGVELPVFCELHTKVAIHDRLGALPRNAPLVIWADPQRLPWTAEERSRLEEDAGARWLLDEFPAGVHTRPEGGADSQVALMLWTYHTEPVAPVLPPVSADRHYPEVVLRGLSTAIPAMRAYFERLPKPQVDCGYYTRTVENRPLIGPLPLRGAHVLGALSGFGIMASPAAGDLLAAHLTGSELPSYAPWFLLERYQDSEYKRLLEDWGDTGAL
ncbi:MAG: FAD-binding oxidoreductase [Anaerolineales bacterium]|jgi:glycine/D-amino acid oxidase-like deaminating enzyme